MVDPLLNARMQTESIIEHEETVLERVIESVELVTPIKKPDEKFKENTTNAPHVVCPRNSTSNALPYFWRLIARRATEPS